MPLNNIPTLLVVAHPDDEWVLLGHLKHLTKVHILIISDCGEQHTTRTQETYAALKYFGLDADVVTFLSDHKSIPDTRAIEHVHDIANFIRQKIEYLHIEQIVSHDFEAGHPDHDAAHLASLIAARSMGCALMCYPMYRVSPSGILLMFAPLAKSTATEDVTKLCYTRRDLTALFISAFVYKTQKFAMGILATYGLISLIYRRGLLLRNVERGLLLTPPREDALSIRRYGVSLVTYNALIATINDDRAAPV